MSRTHTTTTDQKRGGTHSDLDEDLVVLEVGQLDLLDLEDVVQVALALGSEKKWGDGGSAEGIKGQTSEREEVGGRTMFFPSVVRTRDWICWGELSMLKSCLGCVEVLVGVLYAGRDG